MNDSAKTRRERRRERTRGALMKAALDLIAQRGIYATRVQDITEAADLGKGAFYNYFESKDALIAALLSKAVELLQRRYLAELNGSTSIQGRAVEICRCHARFFEEHPSYLLLFHQARGMLQLKVRGNARLEKVFAGFLTDLGSLALPEAHRAAWSEGDKMDLGAVMVGAITGYRSFRIASGLPATRGTAEQVLAGGIPRVLERHQSTSPDGTSGGA